MKMQTIVKLFTQKQNKLTKLKGLSIINFII